MYKPGIGTIKGRSVKKNRAGKKPVRLLQTQITAKDDVQTIEQLRQAGFDSGPLDESRVFYLQISPSWKVAIGVDDGITPEAATGEAQIYSNTGGVKMSWVKAHPNGKVEIGNATAELLSLLNDNLTEVINALNYLKDDITFSNGGGPTGPPSNGALLVPIIANLTTTQTLLGSLKV